MRLLILLLFIITSLQAGITNDSIKIIKPMTAKEIKEYFKIYNLGKNNKIRYKKEFLKLAEFYEVGFRVEYSHCIPANKDSTEFIVDKRFKNLGGDSWPHLFYKADINNDGHLEFIKLNMLQFGKSKYDNFFIAEIYSLREDKLLLDITDNYKKIVREPHLRYDFVSKPFLISIKNKIYFNTYNPYISLKDDPLYSSQWESSFYSRYSTEAYDEYYRYLWENDSIKIVDYKKIKLKVKPDKPPVHKDSD